MISYRPGTWFGIVGEHATVLLPPSEKARAGTLWALVDDGAGFDDVLDALVSAGLRALPGFVLLSTEDDLTRVVVRGPSKASFVTDEGDVVVEGSTSSTWVERSLRGVTGLSVVLEDTDEPLLTLHGGLIRLAALVSPGQVETVQAPTPVAVPAATPPASAQAPAPLPLSGDAGEVSGPYAAVLPFPAGAPAAPAIAAVPSSGAGPDAGEADAADAGQPDQADAPIDAPRVAESADAPADEPAEGAAGESGDDLDVPAWASASNDPLTGPVDDESWADEPTGLIPIVGAEEPVEPAVEPPAEEPAAQEPATEEAASPEQSADSSPEPPAWTPQTPPGPGLPGAVPPPPPFPPAPPAPPAPPYPPSALDVPSWGAVPSAEQAEAEEPQQPEPEQAAPPAPPTDDHDGLTRAGLPDAALLPPPPGIPGQQAAPAVTAYPVAKLEFSHGEQVDVDRVVIVGRAPEAGRFSLAEQPLLVTVPSPHQEISSTHIEIRPGTGVDHGAAVVTDLGSTNGTVVVQPGLGPEELRPGVPVQLMPGALIDLGDGLTIRVTQP